LLAGLLQQIVNGRLAFAEECGTAAGEGRVVVEAKSDDIRSVLLCSVAGRVSVDITKAAGNAQSSGKVPLWRQLALLGRRVHDAPAALIDLDV
jgi:hypothetical protein